MLTLGATTGLVALQASGARSGKIALGMIGAWVGSWLGYFVGIAVSTPVLSVELTWKADAPTLVLHEKPDVVLAYGQDAVFNLHSCPTLAAAPMAPAGVRSKHSGDLGL